MKRTIYLLAVAALLTATACSGDGDDTTTSEPPAAETTSALSGSAQVDACIAAIIDATDHIDLSAPDAEAQLDEAFGPDEPVECGFFNDGPESVGLTADELYKALEDGLPADLFEWIGAPSDESFEETADEL